MKLASSKADYKDISEGIYHLHEQKQNTLVENANRAELRKRIADMSTFLREQSVANIEYNEQLVRWLIEKVNIYEDKFTLEFKSGVTVVVNI